MKKLILLIIAISFLSAGHKYTNALIYEESPYLLQHAHNPVNWLPWGEEAFKKAKREHKPIFLSIGYSTCHWCHVMEEESFENEEIAKLINENFIPIKVDKEERPDIDKYYQKVYQVIHQRSGGWPLTIILTEDLKPFFAATYIPPEDGYGVKGLKTILPVLAKAYINNRETIEKRADAILSLMKKVENAEYVPVHLDLSIAKKFLMQTKEYFDPVYKGFSKRIKFPESSRIRALIDIYMITKEKSALKMANETLIAMAKWGIYDQINGAFFRYTTDRKWQIPHFEKMLYTNAELIDVYTRMYKITKNPLFKKVVEETIKEIDTRFGYEGLYFSASDADTEGVEGGFFIYDYQKTFDYFVKNGFNKQKAEKTLAFFGIKKDGNIDGDYSNPYIDSEIELNDNDKSKALKLLREIRKKRKYPFIDKKIIAAWNAMYIDAKLSAYYIRDYFKKEALSSLNTLIEKMYIDGVLYHQYIPPFKPTKKAFLEDYAYLVKALLSAYEYTLEKRYLELANKFLKEAKEKFFKKGKWYLSNEKFRTVADLNDSYYTSALSVMIHNFLTIGALKEELKYLEDANYIINRHSALIFHDPAAFPEATRAVLRLKVGDVIIKSMKEKILKNLKRVLDIKYPYIFVKEEDTEQFLACKIDTCFISDYDLNKVIEKIENLLKFEKKGIKVKWDKKIE
ncbi:thioredoxin domain-containing protein [Nitrosophilus labii]|uniref:thioredoxin domain-containing protein n=1 Tax=Nitrosophilus labii TaxID=2706014 RepID=UPI00165725A8|nr:thioredoxin domain-containing protein [Nitrosophilus labii]